MGSQGARVKDFVRDADLKYEIGHKIHILEQVTRSQDKEGGKVRACRRVARR